MHLRKGTLRLEVPSVDCRSCRLGKAGVDEVGFAETRCIQRLGGSRKLRRVDEVEIVFVILIERAELDRRRRFFDRAAGIAPR